MRSDLRLERLARAHEAALRDMATEFRESGEDRLARVLDDPDGFFRDLARFEIGADLPPDRVQQTQFLLLRGDRLLGGVRLRHRLIPVLERDGGHIGYEIRPAERRRGHGGAILSLALREARRIGLDRVLLTVAESNAASIRIIEKQSGRPDGTAISPETGGVMRRYWIDLADGR